MAKAALFNLSSLPLLGNRPIFPVGLAAMQKELQGHGHIVEIVDYVDSPIKFRELEWLDETFDLVGFGIRDIDPIDLVLGSFVEGYVKFAKQIQDHLSSRDIRPILVGGGAGFTLFADELRPLLGLDHSISGPGESSLLRLMDSLDQKRPPASSPAKSTFNSTQPSGLVRSYLLRSHDEIGVETRRMKCVKRCNYCPYAFIAGDGLGHYMDMDRIRLEIVSLYELGVRKIFFTDSVFNSEPRFAKEVCRMVISLGYPDLTWSAYFTPSSFDAELASLISRSNPSVLVFSPDSFDDRQMKITGKMFSTKNVLSARDLVRKFRLPSVWVLLFGAPYETVDSIVSSAIFAKEHFSPEEINIQIGVRILPHTEIARGLGLSSFDLMRPSFYPIREGTFDTIFSAFGADFFGESRFLRYLSLRVFSERLTKIPVRNSFDSDLNYFLSNTSVGG